MSPEAKETKAPAAPALDPSTLAMLTEFVTQLKKPTEAEAEEYAAKALIKEQKQRNRRALLKQQEDIRRQDDARKQACSHQRKDGSYCITPVHNYPDNVVRGICGRCNKFFLPGDPQYVHVMSALSEASFG